jgi:catechol 2,3-dioxygenase-like lactoylglutathione lyase family enzyme
MSRTDVKVETSPGSPSSTVVDMNIEALVLPVSDVDRAKRFYANLDWRLDADVSAGDLRLIQFTPPGSGCSVQFGAKLTAAAPGSGQDVYLVVSDLKATRNELMARGVKIGDIFHEGVPGARFLETDHLDGPPADRSSYGSFARFTDPDGNGWLLQEVTTRLPGRVDQTTTSYESAHDLTSALRRAAAAHGEHEARTSQEDANWPEWYADFMVSERAGAELPH